jgi:lantibiotic modifying enzyme
MTARRVHLDIDPEPVRLARGLKIFIQRAAARPLGKARARVSSTDGILTPVASFAVNRLRQELRRMKVRVTKAVWRDLRQNIAERLIFALTPTLRFHKELAKTVARGLKPVGSHRSDSDITLLESFAEFPDLLDTATRLISSWIAAQLELFTRMFVDKRNLSTFFFTRRPLRVARIQAGLSDPHDGGRTVTMIQFDGGLRVIYKPRRCDGELLWLEALRWLDRNGIHADFRIPKILARKGYFWMEFLRKRDCKNAAQIRSFYFRWGIQAAMAQILGATDLHRDNWVPVGSQPILVDAELMGDAEMAPENRLSLDRHLPAVLQTGLLPITARDRAGFYRGIAPFDELLLEKGPMECWPRCRGTIEKPARYVEELVAGFQAATDFFSSRRIQKDFFKEIILRIPRSVRVLQRATAQYARLLRESLEARKMFPAGQRRRWLTQECLRSAASRRIGLGEACALLRCDIPKFTKPFERLPISRQQFLTAIVDLKQSLRLFRNRVLLGKRLESDERRMAVSAFGRDCLSN